MSAGRSATRAAGEVAVGLVLAGLLVAIVAPAQPAAGPLTAVGLSILCVGAVVWLDRHLFGG